jgi:hypothetical protein
MDNKLAENMLRFGVKNLSEASKLKLMSEQAAVPLKPNTATPAQLVVDYNLIHPISWTRIQENTANHGTTSGKVNGMMTWKYPTKSAVTQGYPLYDANGKIDATKIAAYDKQYNIVLQQALADTTWCNMVISQINTSQWTPSQIINFQTQIANNITNRALVASNGGGGAFNDGIYGVATLRAFATYRMQLLNNQDSRYLIAQKLI